MKRLKYGILTFLLIISCVIVGTSLLNKEKGYHGLSSKEIKRQKPTNQYHDPQSGITIYTLKVTKIVQGKDGRIYVKGQTNAPNGALVLAQSLVANKKDVNLAATYDKVAQKYTYAKVKKHHFDMFIDGITFLVPGQVVNISLDQKLKFRVFAVTGYEEDFENYRLNPALRKIIPKASINPVGCRANVQLSDDIVTNEFY